MAVGTIAGFVATKPRWVGWRRRATGTLLEVAAALLARKVPNRAGIQSAVRMPIPDMPTSLRAMRGVCDVIGQAIHASGRAG
ncbi:hypothetical protein AB0C34_06100 [Nocardia sp. NPDC049220]|uniref:hypothetical protein n=1 Tax=Nocardia sp. NPDC049220 TaxID=3155273 RepID=UPI0034048BCF